MRFVIRHFVIVCDELPLLLSMIMPHKIALSFLNVLCQFGLHDKAIMLQKYDLAYMIIIVIIIIVILFHYVIIFDNKMKHFDNKRLPYYCSMLYFFV